MRGLVRALLAAGLAGLALLALAYAEATRTPAIVSYDIASPAWTGPPVTIALLADTHAARPDMPPARLRRIVAQANALRPDLVLLAGDYVTARLVQLGHISPAEATAPFAGLAARWGAFAVLGNHDMETPGLAEAVTAGLEAAGVTVLRNRAARAGPLWVAGADDNEHGVTGVSAAIAGVPAGAALLYLVHNPDNLVDAPAHVGLTLAGHSHGGQVVLPGLGPLVLPLRRREWARGHIVWRGLDGLPRHMVVTSGLGASVAPVRLGVPPEIVLVRLRGAGAGAGPAGAAEGAAGAGLAGLAGRAGGAGGAGLARGTEVAGGAASARGARLAGGAGSARGTKLAARTLPQPAPPLRSS